jgi:hypothetical protein
MIQYGTADERQERKPSTTNEKRHFMECEKIDGKKNGIVRVR